MKLDRYFFKALWLAVKWSFIITLCIASYGLAIWYWPLRTMLVLCVASLVWVANSMANEKRSKDDGR